MKSSSRAIWVLTGLVILPLVAEGHEPGAHASSVPAQNISDQAKPAVAVVDEFSASLKAGDLKQAGGMLADDVLVLESGGAERSREEYIGQHATDDAVFLKSATITVLRRTARAEGSFAWVGTESEISVMKKGEPRTLLSTETMVLKRTAGVWRIVHIHWSSRPKR